MHYQNGRSAVVGDLVIGQCYKGSDVVVGFVEHIELEELTSLCSVTFLADDRDTPCQLRREQANLRYFLHAEDAWRLTQHTVEYGRQPILPNLVGCESNSLPASLPDTCVPAC